MIDGAAVQVGMDILLKAKEYFDGDPFTIAIYNYDADYVAIKAFKLADSERTRNAILPGLFIARGTKEDIVGSATRISKTQTDLSFQVLHQGKEYDVVFNYSWESTKVGDYNLSITHNNKSVKSTGGLFIRTYIKHEDGLEINTLATGPAIQIGFGNFQNMSSSK